MKQRLTWKWIAQLVVVLASAAAMKQYYSTAGANQLRWILAPTTAAVELVTGESFEFEPYAGYINADRSFLIASSCAGINFLIAAFLMLSAGKLLRDRSPAAGWRFIPAAALVAYLATLAANTVRIAIWLRLGRPAENSLMTPGELHRVEGIVVYFGCLLLLFAAAESMARGKSSSLLRQSLLPLIVYYAMMLGIPLANGGYRHGSDFWGHSAYVLLIPVLLIMPLAAYRLCRHWHARQSISDM